MESQPQNPEFRFIPENFYPYKSTIRCFSDLTKLVYIADNMRQHIRFWY